MPPPEEREEQLHELLERLKSVMQQAQELSLDIREQMAARARASYHAATSAKPQSRERRKTSRSPKAKKN